MKAGRRRSLGADDYLVKPFDLDEFLARVRALLCRAATEAPLVLCLADLELDPRTRRVRRGGRPIELAGKPFAILDLLLRRAGQVVSRAELAEHVWDRFFDPFSNVIDVTMHQLRAKVDRGGGPRLIHTVRGVGYVLRTEPVNAVVAPLLHNVLPQTGVPGDVVELRVTNVPDLSPTNARVRIGGRPAAVVEAADGLLRVTVPTGTAVATQWRIRTATPSLVGAK